MKGSELYKLHTNTRINYRFKRFTHISIASFVGHRQTVEILIRRHIIREFSVKIGI